MDILSLLLRGTPLRETASLGACFDALETLDASFSASVDRASAGGFNADRLGYAFVAGYRAALTCIDSSLERASLCATEEGGAHPRAIQTRLVRQGAAYMLDGKKSFATLASSAETLLVVASAELTDTRNHLRVVRLSAHRDGITLRDRPPLPFAPEIPHAEITFESVRVEPHEVLEGDGYERVLKPFRTIEDVHVTAAWLGYVVRLVRGSADDVVERALAAIVALRDVCERDASAPETHLLLAGILSSTEVLARDLDLSSCNEQTRERWHRDRPLFDVAKAARKLRREAARNKLSARIMPPAA